MPMKVKIVRVGPSRTEYALLPKGWRELVEGKIGRKVNDKEVAMEVNTVLRIFAIDQKGKIIEDYEQRRGKKNVGKRNG